MAVARKLAHVHTYFRHHRFGHPPVHSGNLVHQRQWLLVRLIQLGDLFVQSCYQLIQLFEVIPLQLQLKAVMLAHPATQGTPQLRNLIPQAAAGHLRQHRGVLLAADPGPQHVSPRRAQYIGGHRT